MSIKTEANILALPTRGQYISQAAKAARVDHKTVHRLMKKYGIKFS